MREKLIELLEEFPKICADGVECKDCQYNKENGGVGCTSLLADYLISHGVVVRDKGEWIKMHSLYIQDGAYKRQCSCCKKNTTNLGEPLDFCPNCGADMREAIDMSLNKAITHGKEHRKPYRGSKAIDRTCRNHGGCDWCKENRQHKFRDKKPKENKDDI